MAYTVVDLGKWWKGDMLKYSAYVHNRKKINTETKHWKEERREGSAVLLLTDKVARCFLKFFGKFC